MMAFFACDTMVFFLKTTLSHTLRLVLNTLKVFDGQMKSGRSNFQTDHGKRK